VICPFTALGGYVRLSPDLQLVGQSSQKASLSMISPAILTYATIRGHRR
jgi:hypothetical protein